MRSAWTKQSAMSRSWNTPYTSVAATNNLAFLTRVNDLIMITPNLNSAVGSLGSKPADDAIEGALIALRGCILSLFKTISGTFTTLGDYTPLNSHRCPLFFCAQFCTSSKVFTRGPYSPLSLYTAEFAKVKSVQIQAHEGKQKLLLPPL